MVEAQLIVGLEKVTAEDAGRNLHDGMRPGSRTSAKLVDVTRPWPFSDLFKEMGNKVEVFDYEKYNFVTPIIKPEAMERGELLDRVMNNYRRFYIK